MHNKRTTNDDIHRHQEEIRVISTTSPSFCVTTEYSKKNARCLSPTKWLLTEYSEYSNVVFIAVVSQDKMKASHRALQVFISDQSLSEGKHFHHQDAYYGVFVPCNGSVGSRCSERKYSKQLAGRRSTRHADQFTHRSCGFLPVHCNSLCAGSSGVCDGIDNQHQRAT